MPKIKAELMTTPIKFYLRQYVTKAGDQPEAIPSERILCARFNVARGTIRDAIQQLENDGSLIRLPEKKGVFTNPRYSNPSILLVGLIAHGNIGFPSEFSSDSAMLMSGFYRLMPQNAFYCNLMFPDRFPEDDLVRVFSNQNLDALLWFSPPPCYANLIARLRAGNVPLFTGNTTHRIKYFIPDSPFDFYPEQTSFDFVLRRIRELAPEKALICHADNYNKDSFWLQKAFQNAEIGTSDKEFLLLDSPDSAKVAEKLKNAPEKTALYATGEWYIKNAHIMEAVRLSGRKDVELVLENNRFSRCRKEEFSDLKIHLIDMSFLKYIRRTGENTAKGIIRYTLRKQQEKEK